MLQVRIWDAETGTHTDTYNGRKAISSIAVPSGPRELVAFAGAAKVLNVWDPRKRQADDGVSLRYCSKALGFKDKKLHQISGANIES